MFLQEEKSIYLMDTNTIYSKYKYYEQRSRQNKRNFSRNTFNALREELRKRGVSLREPKKKKPSRIERQTDLPSAASDKPTQDLSHLSLDALRKRKLQIEAACSISNTLAEQYTQICRAIEASNAKTTA